MTLKVVRKNIDFGSVFSKFIDFRSFLSSKLFFVWQPNTNIYCSRLLSIEKLLIDLCEFIFSHMALIHHSSNKNTKIALYSTIYRHLCAMPLLSKHFIHRHKIKHRNKYNNCWNFITTNITVFKICFSHCGFSTNNVLWGWRV